MGKNRYDAEGLILDALPPMHRDLARESRIGVRMMPQDWEWLLASLQRHDEYMLKSGKHALPTDFRQGALPLLRVLLADVAPGQPVALSFQDPDPNYGPKVSVPDVGIRRGTTERFSFDTPIMAEAVLRDGSKLFVRVLRRQRLREWRRTRNGKTKWKSKVKDSFRVEAVLVLPKGIKAVHPSSPPPRGIDTKVKQGTRDRITVRGKLGQQINGNMFFDAMTEAFRWSPRTRMTEAA